MFELTEFLNQNNLKYKMVSKTAAEKKYISSVGLGCYCQWKSRKKGKENPPLLDKKIIYFFLSFSVCSLILKLSPLINTKWLWWTILSNIADAKMNPQIYCPTHQRFCWMWLSKSPFRIFEIWFHKIDLLCAHLIS